MTSLFCFVLILFAPQDQPIRYAGNIPASVQVREGNYDGAIRERIGESHPVTNGVVIGILLFLAIYNMGFYFAVRDTAFLWYVCFQFLTCLTWMSVHNYYAELMDPRIAAFNDELMKILMVLMAIAFFLFTKTFLRLKHYLPQWNRVLARVVLFSYAFAFLMGIVLESLEPLDINTRIVGVIYLPLVVILAVITFRKGHVLAGYFLAAQLFFVTGAVLRIVVHTGIIPVNFFTVNSIEYGSVAEAIIFSLGLRHRYRVSEWYKQKIKMAACRQQAAASQMNAHFLFNSLTSLQTLVMRNRRTDALNYLSGFARLVRRVLENSYRQDVYLSDELELIEAYLEMERLRALSNFSYEICMDPSVDPGEIMIPSFLLQPFLENAILHGFNGREGGRLKLQFEGLPEALRCTIEDNGVGRREAAQRQISRPGSTSLGIELVAKRLSLMMLSGKGRQPVTVSDVINENGHITGTRVTIHIPLRHERPFLY